MGLVHCGICYDDIYRVTGHLCGEFIGPGEFPHKVRWRGALMFSLICARINGWVNNRETVDLRRHRAHYDVNVMCNSYDVTILFTYKQTSGPLSLSHISKDGEKWQLFKKSTSFTPADKHSPSDSRSGKNNNNKNITWWGRDKMSTVFQTIFSNEFSWMKMYEFRLEFHWSLLAYVIDAYMCHLASMSWLLAYRVVIYRSSVVLWLP